jgi:hypothetical protein
MKKTIIISNRSVYHKYAEVEIILPTDIKEEEIADWLFENSTLWEDKLDDKLSESEIDFGFGLDYDAQKNRQGFMDDSESESETRYDLYESHPLKITGGHL